MCAAEALRVRGRTSMESAPETRVCPRCGSAAENYEYCQTCGLHLFAQPELPTRAHWDARASSDTSRELQSGSAAAGTVGWWKRQSARRQATFIVASLVFVLFGSAVAVSGSESTDSSVKPPPPLPDPRGTCIVLWNFSESNPGREQASAFAARGTVVATVGFSIDFPDRCQIVVAAPDLGAGYALVFRQSGGTEEDPVGYQLVTSGSVPQLPASAKEWNARGRSDGTIVLGFP